jgi:hypothetical protein
VGLLLLGAGLTCGVVVVTTWWDALIRLGSAAGARPGSLIGWAPVVLAVFALIVVGIGQALAVGSLFRLVLSQVPASSAGVGSGVLVTAQQTALALGVAGLGSVFTTVGAASSGGIMLAMAVVGAAMVALTFGLAVVSRALPQA